MTIYYGFSDVRDDDYGELLFLCSTQSHLTKDLKRGLQDALNSIREYEDEQVTEEDITIWKMEKIKL